MLDADISIRESLRPRLEKYIVADDVTIRDVTEDYAIIHTLGGGSAEDGAYSCARLGERGYDTVMIKSDVDGVREELLRKDGPPLTHAEVEWIRVRAGVPHWGRELTPDTLPPEARLGARAIDYEKGCYVGQEVVSRMKMAGKTNRILTLFRIVSGSLEAPCEIGDSSGLGGTITTVAVDPLGSGALALGYLRPARAQVGSMWRAVAENEPCAELEAIQYPDAP